MSIKLVFIVNRELLNFQIDGKIIRYTDRKWKHWLQCLPRPDDFIKQINMSRNVFPSFLTHLFQFTEEEITEYESAKNEEELAEIIIRDCSLKGCKLISRENSEKIDTVQKKEVISEIDPVIEIEKVEAIG